MQFLILRYTDFYIQCFVNLIIMYIFSGTLVIMCLALDSVKILDFLLLQIITTKLDK